jgi:hypothetical protein
VIVAVRAMAAALLCAAAAGCSTQLAPPVLSSFYVLVDADPPAHAPLPDVVDRRASVSASRVTSSSGTTLGEEDFRTPVPQALRAELWAFSQRQWSAERVARLLASKPIHLVEFQVRIAPLDQSGVASHLGDLRLTVGASVDGQLFMSTAVEVWSSGDTIPAYLTRHLFAQAVADVGRQIMAKHANDTERRK